MSYCCNQVVDSVLYVTTDFVPVCVGMLLEPLLKIMGYGNYNIRPSAFCGFATCLVTNQRVSNTPVSRFFYLKRLYHKLEPIVKLLENPNTTIGLGFVKRIKKVHSFFCSHSSANVCIDLDCRLLICLLY